MSGACRAASSAILRDARLCRDWPPRIGEDVVAPAMPISSLTQRMQLIRGVRPIPLK